MNEAAVQEVAQNSRAKAETYLSQGNWGRAFAHLLLCINLKPEWKNDLQNTVANCLCETAI
jgi:hypothetical protein